MDEGRKQFWGFVGVVIAAVLSASLSIIALVAVIKFTVVVVEFISSR